MVRARRPPTRRRAVLPRGAAVVVAAACSAFLAVTAGVAADLTLPDLEGRRHDLEELRGRIVVVNFWATWCLPCRAEMPILADLHRRRAAEGVVVLGASADDPDRAEAVARYVRRQALPFPIRIGATTADMARLGLGSGLPATALVDRDGRVVARVDGVVDEAGLEAWIDWLLGDRTAPAPPSPAGAPVPAGGPAVDSPEEHEGHAHDEGAHHHGAGVGLDGPSLVPS